jgi:hypothetical protein
MAFLESSPVDAQLDRSDMIPSNIFNTGVLSTTNDALTCFTKQVFTADLQAYLITYVIAINSYQSIYK